jgi:hypothetical protein
MESASELHLGSDVDVAFNWKTSYFEVFVVFLNPTRNDSLEHHVVDLYI